MAMDAACGLGPSPDEASAFGVSAHILPAAGLLDLAHLRRYTGGCEDLEREIIGLFCAAVPGYVAALEQAKTPKDWHMAAHTLKGSALAVGANRLALAAAAAEKAPLAERAAIAAVTTAVCDVIAELVRLRLA